MAEYSKHPFLLTVAETAQALGTDVDKGLTSAQVAELQTKYPKNELDVGGTVPWYKIFTKQLLNAMILVSFCLRPLFSLASLCLSFFFPCFCLSSVSACCAGETLGLQTNRRIGK